MGVEHKGISILLRWAVTSEIIRHLRSTSANIIDKITAWGFEQASHINTPEGRLRYLEGKARFAAYPAADGYDFERYGNANDAAFVATFLKRTVIVVNDQREEMEKEKKEKGGSTTAPFQVYVYKSEFGTGTVRNF